jgi:3-(3-hydroxy-phenyl)propionate hydroxylase
VAQAKVPGTQDTHYQVVVVGAGPTGLITTNLLGQDGIKTLLVEQHESTVSQPRAVSIDDEALRTVQSVGLIKEVLDDVAQDYGSWYFTATGRCFAKVEPQTREFGYPRRNAFQQPRLEATLRRLFIQPRLELPDRSITLLDDLIGNRFTCLSLWKPY